MTSAPLRDNFLQFQGKSLSLLHRRDLPCGCRLWCARAEPPGHLEIHHSQLPRPLGRAGEFQDHPDGAMVEVSAVGLSPDRTPNVFTRPAYASYPPPWQRGPVDYRERTPQPHHTAKRMYAISFSQVQIHTHDYISLHWWFTVGPTAPPARRPSAQ